MKKLITLLLAMTMLVTLCACGGNDADKPNEDTTTTTTVTTADGGTSATTTPATTTTTTSGTTTATDVGEPGVTVPIGTKPTTTTTTTVPTTAPTTAPNGSGTTTTATTTTATTTTTTTTTVTTAPTVEPLYITLPAVGSDIDVTKKKNRIRVSAVSAWKNDDGTIGVSMSFRNYTNTWITEETDYVEYTCYDKSGKVVQRATRLYIGVIDTKAHPEKSFELVVPGNTAEVKITKSKIVYWTEWA